MPQSQMPDTSVLKSLAQEIGSLIGLLNEQSGKSLFWASVRRPSDLAVFEAGFENLKLDANTPPNLVRTDTARDAFLIALLPPQSFGEQAYLSATGPNKADDTADAGQYPLNPMPSSKIRMSGKAKLVFTMPASVTSLPYTVAGVMQAMRDWPQWLDLIAAPPPIPGSEWGFRRGKSPFCSPPGAG